MSVFESTSSSSLTSAYKFLIPLVVQPTYCGFAASNPVYVYAPVYVKRVYAAADENPDGITFSIRHQSESTTGSILTRSIMTAGSLGYYEEVNKQLGTYTSFTPGDNTNVLTLYARTPTVDTSPLLSVTMEVEPQPALLTVGTQAFPPDLPYIFGYKLVEMTSLDVEGPVSINNYYPYNNANYTGSGYFRSLSGNLMIQRNGAAIRTSGCGVGIVPCVEDRFGYWAAISGTIGDVGNYVGTFISNSIGTGLALIQYHSGSTGGSSLVDFLVYGITGGVLDGTPPAGYINNMGQRKQLTKPMQVQQIVRQSGSVVFCVNDSGSDYYYTHVDSVTYDHVGLLKNNLSDIETTGLQVFAGLPHMRLFGQMTSWVGQSTAIDNGDANATYPWMGNFYAMPLSGVTGGSVYINNQLHSTNPITTGSMSPDAYKTATQAQEDSSVKLTTATAPSGSNFLMIADEKALIFT